MNFPKGPADALMPSMEGEKRTSPGMIAFSEGPPPDLGRIIDEREIPSDVILVIPLILRLMGFLEEAGIVGADFKNELALCLDEAVRNAIVHGNRRDFSKKVRLRAFVNESRWGVAVEDEGAGFRPEDIPDPLDEGSLWKESGRGIRLIQLHMDRVEYYRGGRSIVMAKDLRGENPT